MERQLGFGRLVLVQPSYYGTDNACLLDALQRLGQAARGVAVIAEGAGECALQTMHAAGVRGIRVNLHTVGESDPVVARRRINRAADLANDLGWHVEIYSDIAVLAPLRDFLFALPTPIVIDHFGRPAAREGLKQKGFSELLSLVGLGKAYVKISAPYRISNAIDYADVEPFVRAFLDAAPKRVLWGTDWPHTVPFEATSCSRPEIARIENNVRALDLLKAWTRSQAEFEAVLVSNPARLYGF